ncbi:MAG: hypothetical protein QXG03_00355 [Halalkalicoccus sp.]
MDDILSAMGAGAAGSAVVTAILLVTQVTSGFGVHVFRILAEMVGSDSVLLGLVLFFGGGMITWPLLYITLGQYLPGEGAARGMIFAAVLWLGFAPAFSSGVLGTGAPAVVQGRAGLLIYLLVTLFAHLIYGAILGAGYLRLGGSEMGSPAV